MREISFLDVCLTIIVSATITLVLSSAHLANKFFEYFFIFLGASGVYYFCSDYFLGKVRVENR